MYGDLLFLVAGVLLILLNRQLAKGIIWWQNSVWRFRFGEREVQGSRLVIVLVGTIFVLFSVLAFLDTPPGQ
jgi:hypothetical protein